MLLQVPLTGKIIGANAIIVAAALFAAFLPSGGGPASGPGEVGSAGILLGALLLALVVNVGLVSLALKPLHDIEATVQAVWQGDLGARVPVSVLADSQMVRVGQTLNTLLDSLTSDRDRMRRLAQKVISAGDLERAAIARSLHDSAAQTLAALVFQASAAAQDGHDPEMTARLQGIRDLAVSIMEEVRVLGQSVYPQVLHNLGLATALRRLARDSESHTAGVNVEVNVENPDVVAKLPTDVATALYFVAREAVGNAVRHGSAGTIEIDLSSDGSSASLVVADNGHGFDAGATEATSNGTGLFGMRERLALFQGELSITSRNGEGTTLAVTVPLNKASSE
jgi:signal transduction histidine kinase